ncbi:MAG: hypothetical protein WB510_18835 [Candidatus Sulfotelmatobacter sp.]
MNQILKVALSCLLFAPALGAQSAPQTLYAESFRHGSTRITEESFEAKLDPRNPVYRERIKDTRGVDRYVLSIVPLGPLGDNKITSWQVKLADLRHSIYDNILLASQSPSPDPKDNLWWLTPRRYAAVSIDARRVIKVDGFYVVLQVKAYHFTPLDSPYLDSMTVQVRFTNSDPRSGEGR